MPAGEVVGGAVDVYPNPVKQIHLPLEVDKMNALLGTNVSKEEVLEYFARDPESRTEIKIIVAKTEDSTKAITLQTLLTSLSSSNIIKSLDLQSKVLGMSYPVTLNELLNMYIDPYLEVVLPSMTLYGNYEIGDEKENITTSSPKAIVKIDGSTITKDNKILGYLDLEESKILNLINGKLKETIIKMNYYDEIKNELVNNEIYKRVKDYSKNKHDLSTYYNVGKLLSEAGKHYGEGIIKKYSIMITKEFGKGYNETNLKYFRQFYKFSNRHTVCDKLSWSHYRTLLSVSNVNKINYHIIVFQKSPTVSDFFSFYPISQAVPVKLTYSH